MSPTDVRFSSPISLHKPNGYSHIVEVRRGRTIHIAGQVAIAPDGKPVGEGDLREQLEQVFKNLQAALASVGATFENVIKLAYFCVESVPASDMAIVREVRDRFVNTQTPPISTFVFVSRLVRPEWLIEIEAVAVVE
jgi:enamine deaminase RidA (YjgF/YER057c/UK114 family)